MQGTISFHPVDTTFFDDLLNPLLAGKKVNPEGYLKRALKVQSAAWLSARYLRCMDYYLEALAPPPPPTEGKLWDRFRARLERFDYRPDPTSLLVSRYIERDLHLRGRPFFITEGSADRVAAMVDRYCDTSNEAEVLDLAVDQLNRLDPKLGRSVEPAELRSAASLTIRRELMDSLKGLHELALAARRGERYGVAGGAREPAVEVLERELPWRALVLHSRATPFWIADNVDGLETVCLAAGVPPPAFLTPAYRLFGDLCETFPGLTNHLGIELGGEHQVGAWVAGDDVPDLLEFLNTYGAIIIMAASQEGEGAACTTLLRKIRECAKYAELHGLGYLEASGIPPLGPLPDED